MPPSNLRPFGEAPNGARGGRVRSPELARRVHEAKTGIKNPSLDLESTG
jgi:hypothetical protein